MQRYVNTKNSSSNDELVSDNKVSEIDYCQFFSSANRGCTESFLSSTCKLLNELPKDKMFRFAIGNANAETYPYSEIVIRLKDDSEVKIKDADLLDGIEGVYDAEYPPLKELLKSFQDKLHGPQKWTKKDIIVTSGVKDGFYKLLQVCIDDGDVVIVQAPCYHEILKMLKNKNIECLEACCDSYGICPEYLSNMLEDRESKKLKMPKFLYVIPIGGNPLGTNLPNERKMKIYELACKYNILILEDDPYILINLEDSSKSPSFMSMDIEGRVIRFDSCSKTMGYGLRIGYITAANEIIHRIGVYSQSSNVPSILIQVILYKILMHMGFDGFLTLMGNAKQMYKRNRQCMLKSLNKHFKDIAEWVEPQGIFVWLKIKNLKHVSKDFVETCSRKCLFLGPGSMFYVKDRQSPHLRLAYSTASTKEIEKGIKLLAELIREEVALNKENVALN